LEIGDFQSYFLTVGGTSVNIHLTVANVTAGAKLITGRCRVKLSVTGTGLNVTSSVAGAIIGGTAPTTSGADAVLLWELQQTAGGTQRLWAKWDNYP
jgi:hypothetical protein